MFAKNLAVRLHLVEHIGEIIVYINEAFLELTGDEHELELFLLQRMEDSRCVDWHPALVTLNVKLLHKAVFTKVIMALRNSDTVYRRDLIHTKIVVSDDVPSPAPKLLKERKRKASVHDDGYD